MHLVFQAHTLIATFLHEEDAIFFKNKLQKKYQYINFSIAKAENFWMHNLEDKYYEGEL